MILQAAFFCIFLYFFCLFITLFCKKLVYLVFVCIFDLSTATKYFKTQQKNFIMNKQALKIQIENLAKEENTTFIKACQAMQGAAAKLGNEKMISIIHEIKMQSIK